MPTAESRYHLDFGTEDGTTGGTLHPHHVDVEGKLRTKDVDAATILSAIGLLTTDIKNLTTDIKNLTTSQNSLTTDIRALITALTGQLPATLGQTTAAASLSVTLPSDQPTLSTRISGTEDGTPSGTARVFVNTIKDQILAARDRVQAITYADFGTKDQRVIQIDYTATSIGTGAGFTARKTITYTLVGNSYRRDTITWSLV